MHGAPDTTYLARLVMACCAADATPAKVRLQGYQGLVPLPQDGWFEVRGQLVPGSATPATRFTPTLTISDLQPIPASAEPYEF